MHLLIKSPRLPMSTKRYPSALLASLNSYSSEENDSMSFIFRFDEDFTGRGFSEQSLSLPTRCATHADLQTCRLADLQTCRLADFADLQTCRLADLQTCRPADLQTCRLATLDLQTCRPADLQTRRQDSEFADLLGSISSRLHKTADNRACRLAEHCRPAYFWINVTSISHVTISCSEAALPWPANGQERGVGMTLVM